MEAAVDRSETTPQTAAAPSAVSPPTLPEAPKLDRAIAPAASADNTHALVVAPASPTEPKPKSNAPTPMKPATAAKQKPPRTPPASPAKQPGSAYEHM
jgi:hypothetical protein